MKNTAMLHNNYPYLFRLSINELINPTIYYNNVVKTGIKKINNFLKSCITEGIETGDFKKDIDPEVVAISFISIINFYYLTWPLSDDLLPSKDNKIEYYIDQAFDNYLNGILIPKEK